MNNKNFFIISVILIGIIISLCVIIILDKLNPSDEVVDCLNCNPDVLAQFSPTWFSILVSVVILVSGVLSIILISISGGKFV